MTDEQKTVAPGAGEQKIGAVEDVQFTRATRVVSAEPGLVHIRDRDSRGALLAHIGYSPRQALHCAALLTKAARLADPSCHLRAVDAEETT